MADFSQWLIEQLERRNWKPAELARRADIDTGLLSRLLNRERMPGPTTCNAIAEALQLPPQSVFHAAGLIPSPPDYDETIEEIKYLSEKVPIEKRRQILDYIRFISSQESS
ncbi:helix-turn-helix transcriptional regulator [bacterium]|nr:helix-turn-helix transcriptional regulator [bacterium]